MSDQGISVARVEDIQPGTSRLVAVNGKEVALFNVEGRFYAIGNRCPHRSGPLVRGHIEEVSDTGGSGAAPVPEGCATSEPLVLAVRCPIHGWLFELATGRCLTRASARTTVYPVICERGEICLGAPQGESVGPSTPLPSSSSL